MGYYDAPAVGNISAPTDNRGNALLKGTAQISGLINNHLNRLDTAEQRAIVNKRAEDELLYRKGRNKIIDDRATTAFNQKQKAIADQDQYNKLMGADTEVIGNVGVNQMLSNPDAQDQWISKDMQRILASSPDGIEKAANGIDGLPVEDTKWFKGLNDKDKSTYINHFAEMGKLGASATKADEGQKLRLLAGQYPDNKVIDQELLNYSKASTTADNAARAKIDGQIQDIRLKQIAAGGKATKADANYGGVGTAGSIVKGLGYTGVKGARGLLPNKAMADITDNNEYSKSVMEGAIAAAAGRTDNFISDDTVTWDSKKFHAYLKDKKKVGTATAGTSGYNNMIAQLEKKQAAIGADKLDPEIAGILDRLKNGTATKKEVEVFEDSVDLTKNFNNDNAKTGSASGEDNITTKMQKTKERKGDKWDIIKEDLSRLFSTDTTKEDVADSIKSVLPGKDTADILKEKFTSTNPFNVSASDKEGLKNSFGYDKDPDSFNKSPLGKLINKYVSRDYDNKTGPVRVDVPFSPNKFIADDTAAPGSGIRKDSYTNDAEGIGLNLNRNYAASEAMQNYANSKNVDGNVTGESYSKEIENIVSSASDADLNNLLHDTSVPEATKEAIIAELERRYAE